MKFQKVAKGFKLNPCKMCNNLIYVYKVIIIILPLDCNTITAQGGVLPSGVMPGPANPAMQGGGTKEWAAHWQI